MDAKAGYLILSFDDRQSKVRDYKARKVHQKTKGGCLACKAKRVKCDESRPFCIRCRRNDRVCCYSRPDNPGLHSTRPSQAASHDTAGFSKALSNVTIDPSSTFDKKNGTPSVYLMQHFCQHWREIFQLPGAQEVLSFSKSHSIVRSTILAVAACHLRHAVPGVLDYRIAEHFRLSLALQDLQDVISTPLDRLGQSGIDALLLSTTLLNILAFTLPESETASDAEPSPGESWVSSTSKDRLSWLSLQVGLNAMIRSTTTYLEGTLNFLGPLLFGVDREKWVFARQWIGLEGIPELWIKVFELDSDDHDNDHYMLPVNSGKAISFHTNLSRIYRAPIITLAKLQHLEPAPQAVYQNLQFLGKVHKSFRALLFERDDRALWIFGYWLGLTCRFEGTWWSDARVRRDYKATCIWLKERHLSEQHGVKGERWKEMMRQLEMAPAYQPCFWV